MGVVLARQASASVRSVVLLPLLALDAVLIGQHGLLHILHDLDRIEAVPQQLDVNQDRSFAELLNWGKWLGISALLLAVWARSRMPAALGFAVAFALVAADDILSLHESQGAVLVWHLGLESAAGLDAQDLGELLVWAALGAVAVGSVLLGFLASDAAGRRVGRTLLAFLGTLVLFAVGFDMLHALFDAVRGANFLLGVVEDGGEMIVGSLCLAFCATLLMVPPGVGA